MDRDCNLPAVRGRPRPVDLNTAANCAIDQVMLPFKSVIPFGAKIDLGSSPPPSALQFGQLFHFSKISKSILAGGPPQFGPMPFFGHCPKERISFLGRLP